MKQPALSDRPKLRRPARLKYDPARETELLLLPERVVRLNPSAGAILRLCDGERSVAAIIERLERNYPGSDLKGDVLEFLATAADKGWLEPWTSVTLTP
ncbi:pyrroloquinoline quinone biosynthesis peptide chaperone PqqD [Cohnella caldifontis]|uniref:pyrroloquinoline quinone biosynthesis peptide chaperone PqqD n=1 Tax=Cohnella caldifontis TaxID=3027471 RepID=UPI0023EBFEF4|nr:pyrroloquinoline quinone biosynthesis peptide chaperone PqqD [Cohnella sp. YIM B05605]